MRFIRRETAASLRRGERQPKQENGAAAGCIPGSNPPFVVLDNLFADRKTKSRSMRLAVRDEGLKQLALDLGWDTYASVLDFGDNLRPFDVHAKTHFPAARHGI